jgi:hypothetical protein
MNAEELVCDSGHGRKQLSWVVTCQDQFQLLRYLFEIFQRMEEITFQTL